MYVFRVTVVLEMVRAGELGHKREHTIPSHLNPQLHKPSSSKANGISKQNPIPSDELA